MNIDELKQSKYLKRADCGKGILLTIAGLEKVDVSGDGSDEIKAVLLFEESKPLVLNRINAEMIANILGSPETDDWIGHKIVAFDDPSVMFKGKCVGGIRVRALKVKSSPKAKPPEPVQATEESEDDDDILF